MNNLILIKYGELTTKKSNRLAFVKLLASNIEKVLKNEEYKLKYDRVRMYIECENTESIINKLIYIFGIHSIVVCHRVNNNLDEIKNKVLELVSKENFNSFKVETKRALKSFEIHSQDFNKIIGGLVLKNFNVVVDVLLFILKK